MKNYPLETIEEFSAKLLISRGVPEKNAAYIARMAVKTEAMGIKTHGLAVLGYLDSQIPGMLDPDTEPAIISEKGAAVLIDGNNGFSQIAFKLAAEKAVEKAGKNGVAMAAVRNAFWLGALGPYIESIAREGFMVQLWCQSSQCRDCAPVGGIEPRFSTNPVALAFPTDGDPVVADISTAAVSMGATGLLAKADKKARDRIYMDKNGNATDDPKAMLDDGSIFFLGGPEYSHKGYGLSLWAEALTAMGGGSCNNPDLDQRQSLNLTVIDIDTFAGMDYFQKEIIRFSEYMKTSRPRPGFDKIRLPGERGFKALRQAKEEGLPLDDARIEMLNGIARQNNVTPLV